MRGLIVQISISAGGHPKLPTPEGRVTTLGLEGDGHAHPAVHGGPQKAVLLVSAENVEILTSRGYPLFYGALGENLTVRGIDFREVRIGDRFRAGDALLEISQPRGPCSTLDVYGPSIKGDIYDERVKALDYSSPLWGLSGLYARVIDPGAVHVRDAILRE